MFIIRNVTRETVRFIIRNVIRETAMFIIRKVTRESGNVHYQKRYKGEWEGGITPHSNFTPLGQVPRHSPLVPPTVSISPSIPRRPTEETAQPMDQYMDIYRCI